MFDVAATNGRFAASGSTHAGKGEGKGDGSHSPKSSSTTSKSAKRSAADDRGVLPSHSADTDGASSATRNILIVDDDANTTRALQLFLRQSGYDSNICHCGADALKQAAKQKPAAAVIDIHLGDLSGLVLAKKLRELVGDHMPIIMLSGDTSMETLNSLPHVGATYFFSKPMNPTTLIEQLREWVP